MPLAQELQHHRCNAFVQQLFRLMTTISTSTSGCILSEAINFSIFLLHCLPLSTSSPISNLNTILLSLSSHLTPPSSGVTITTPSLFIVSSFQFQNHRLLVFFAFHHLHDHRSGPLANYCFSRCPPSLFITTTNVI